MTDSGRKSISIVISALRLQIPRRRGQCELTGRSAFKLIVKVSSESGGEREETFVKKLHKISQICK